ncbi:CoA protein activase [Alkaliphilus pronyensis]|uniref:CoA protein activase n=1 Tax=Alkaliphilus pronyensis TaxID=1482732 RepID=A0A6I0F923_9FIRM|nr:2-hydroxyacyl-CoA dehydratase [Alkaliphilus pronyensis]KAB3534766.1 CoA protein activase [Alkaliphilus pronyensis]
MKVTFPHMGNQYVATKVLLDELEVENIVPPECSKDTLDIGTQHSPESICLPLKVNIGNYIESIKQGADTIILTGSCGPCRFGYYSILQKEIMKAMGHNINFILLDPPQGDYKSFFARIFKLTNTKNPYKIIKALAKATRVLYLVDEMEEVSCYKRPRQKKIGEVDIYYDGFHKKVRKIHGYREVSKLIKETINNIKSIPEDPNREVIKIGVIGEIYTIIEPFVNLNIHKKLGNMGVEVSTSLKISRWLTEHLYLQPLKLTGEKKIRNMAKPYLKTMIGGHGRETIGHAIDYAKRGFDGVIQIYPFTCMPEIVAQSILPTIEKDFDIPYLCLIVDELTGEAGYTTRLEAFVDLLIRRREMGISDKLLSRN